LTVAEAGGEDSPRLGDLSDSTNLPLLALRPAAAARRARGTPYLSPVSRHRRGDLRAGQDRAAGGISRIAVQEDIFCKTRGTPLRRRGSLSSRSLPPAPEKRGPAVRQRFYSAGPAPRSWLGIPGTLDDFSRWCPSSTRTRPSSRSLKTRGTSPVPGRLPRAAPRPPVVSRRPLAPPAAESGPNKPAGLEYRHPSSRSAGIVGPQGVREESPLPARNTPANGMIRLRLLRSNPSAVPLQPVDVNRRGRCAGPVDGGAGTPATRTHPARRDRVPGKSRRLA